MKKKKTKTAKSKSKPKAKAKKQSAAPKKKAAPKKASSKKTAPKKSSKKSSKKPSKKSSKNWVKFVEQHGVVLASAKGPVPSVAEAIVGEPIVGSWWSHPKGQEIFDALSTIDDDTDNILCFKLVDHKITFVHKRLWPAVAKLAQAGVLDADRVTRIRQEHTPSGEHRNITTPYPDWVPEDIAASAESLSVDEAKSQLGAWVG